MLTNERKKIRCNFLGTSIVSFLGFARSVAK